MIQPRQALRDLRRHPLPSVSRHPVMRLDMNEHVGALPLELIRARLADLDSDSLQSYPEYGPLYAKLATHFALPADHLLVTNGSDSAAKLIVDTFVEVGDGVVLSNPSFAMHRVYAGIAQAAIHECDFQADFAFPAAAMRQAIDARSRLVIVVTPNNPTGATIPRRELIAILQRARESDCVVYVDEAYGEYGGDSAIPLVSEWDNLIVTRTFSKALGLPSVRLGVVFAQSYLLEFLRRSQPIYDVNQFAVILGECILDNYATIETYIDQVREGGDYLRSRLTTLGLPIHIGQANFALIKPGMDPLTCKAALAEHDILISAGFSLAFLRDWIRVTLGPPPLMLRFADALAEVIDAQR